MKIPPLKYLYYVSAVTVTFFFLLMNLGSYMGFSIKGLIDFLIKTSYREHQNIMLYGEFNHIPLPIFIYLAVLISSIILLLLNRILHANKPENYSLDSFRSCFLFSALVAFTFLISIQTISITNAWIRYLERFSQKTEIEKFSGAETQKSLIMAEFCKNLVSGRHKAIFTTDLDITQDPGMILHRSLAFYLYPIDIRGIHQDEPDLWIAFDKREAVKYLPEGYTVIGILNDRNLIAKKK